MHYRARRRLGDFFRHDYTLPLMTTVHRSKMLTIFLIMTMMLIPLSALHSLKGTVLLYALHSLKGTVS